MTIDDLLNLEYSKDAIKKLDQFLAKTSKTDNNYLKVLCHKLEISPKVNDSLKEAYSYVISFNTMNDEEVILICNTIMKLVLKANRLDEYEKYMLIKANRMPIKDNKDLHYDRFIYYKALTNYNEAIIEITKYLEYDLNISEQIKGLSSIINLAFETKNYELFFKYYKQLLTIYQNNQAVDDRIDLIIKALYLDYDFSLYDKALELANNLLTNDAINNTLQLKVANIALNILIKKEEYRKASILESEYAPLLLTEKGVSALEFAKSALNLYEKINNLVSIKYYKDLVNKLVEDNKPKNHKNKKEVYIIPEIIDDNNNKLDKVVIKAKEVEVKTKEYEISNNIITKVANILCKDYKLREILRNLGDLLVEEFNITKFNLIYKANKFYLHTYKNNKVYDRCYNDLVESYIFYCYKKGESLFLDSDIIADNLDIFTNKPFDSNFVADIPLVIDDEVIGVIEILSDKDFLAINNNYELIKIIVDLLTVRIKNEIGNLLLNNKYELENYLLGNFYYGIKQIKVENLILNGEARRILRINDEITLNEFYNYIDSEDVLRYKEFIKDLYENKGNNKVIYYKYKKDNIIKYLKEIYYVYLQDDKYILISLLSDETSKKEEELNINNKAYIDNITNLYNINKLYNDLECLKEKRYSLAIFSTDDIKEYKDLYGYGFYIDFIKTLAKGTIIYFRTYYNVSCYILSEYEFALIIHEFSDKRKEETLLKKYLKYLQTLFIDLKYTVYPTFKMGVYTHIREDKKTTKQIFDNAYNAYLMGKDNTVTYFSFKEYKEYFKEKEKYVLLKENILNNQIKVSYTQLIDVINQEVYAYVVNLNMPNLNIYEDEIEEILLRHHKLELYHRYKLTTLCKELKELYNVCDAYVELVSVFNHSDINETFSDFVLTQLNFFKLPTDVLSIVVDKYSPYLEQLQKANIKIITKDIYDILNNKVKNLYLDLAKLDESRLVLINKALTNLDVTIYLGNVNNKDSLVYIKEANINYIYGQVYSKTYNIKELIEKIRS